MSNVNLRDLNKLDKELSDAIDDSYIDLSIWILPSFTINQIEKMMRVSLIKEGFNPTIKFTEYNQYPTQILDPDSTLRQSNIDYAIFTVRMEDLIPNYLSNFYSSKSNISSEKVFSYLDDYIDLILNLKDQSNCICLVNDFVAPKRTIHELQSNSDIHNQVHKINSRLRDKLKDVKGVYIAGFESSIYDLGVANSLDDRMLYYAQAPYTPELLFTLSQHYVKLVKTISRPRKKALVVDLDNTLWGGILGEDGIKGIQIGNDYPGNIFLEIQKCIKSYSDKGIILAINSKNNLIDAEEVFNKHPEIFLKLTDFSVTKINWESKEKNLLEISKELNIGLDSIVFIDDSLFEIGLIKASLPEVECIQFTENLILNLETIRNIDSFDTLAITEEDKQKKALYKNEEERRKIRSKSTNLEGYLHQLEMKAVLSRVDQNSFNRTLQLINKTNQFNLTGKRFTDLELEKKLSLSGSSGFTIQAQDKFGDYGIVGVSIIKTINNNDWQIDVFLLSCRILGRGVEKAFLSSIVSQAKSMGIQSILGKYIPSKKNQHVKTFFKDNGFEKSGSNWIYEIKDKNMPTPNWIELQIV